MPDKLNNFLFKTWTAIILFSKKMHEDGLVKNQKEEERIVWTRLRSHPLTADPVLSTMTLRCWRLTKNGSTADPVFQVLGIWWPAPFTTTIRHGMFPSQSLGDTYSTFKILCSMPVRGFCLRTYSYIPAVYIMNFDVWCFLFAAVNCEFGCHKITM